MKNLVTILKRLKYAKEIRDYFINHSDIFIYKKFEQIYLLYSTKQDFEKYIVNHLGTIGGSVDAEAYKLEPKKGYKLALKICPLTKIEMIKIMNTQYRIWRELHILKEIYKLIKNHLSPNLPIIYFYFICKNMKKNDYENPNIKKIYNNNNIRNDIKETIKSENETKAILLDKMIKRKDYGTNSLCIVNELCNTTIKDLLMNSNLIDKIDDNIFKSFIFQIISGIYTYTKHGNIAHFDLHGGNILISYVQPDNYWHYNINNKDYYIYNYGYILKIWDFGRSYIINNDNTNIIITQLKAQMNRFMEQLFVEDPKLKEDMYKILNTENLYLICFCFDLWRIISYILSKIQKNDFLLYKFTETIKLLEKIKQKCIYNWIYALVNRNINNTIEDFTDYLLNKYFKNYTIPQTNIINNIIYKC